MPLFCINFETHRFYIMYRETSRNSVIYPWEYWIVEISFSPQRFLLFYSFIFLMIPFEGIEIFLQMWCKTHGRRFLTNTHLIIQRGILKGSLDVHKLSFFGQKEERGRGWISLSFFETNLTGLRSRKNWAVIAKRTLYIT